MCFLLPSLSFLLTSVFSVLFWDHQDAADVATQPWRPAISLPPVTKFLSPEAHVNPMNPTLSPTLIPSGDSLSTTLLCLPVFACFFFSHEGRRTRRKSRKENPCFCSIFSSEQLLLMKFLKIANPLILAMDTHAHARTQIIAIVRI